MEEEVSPDWRSLPLLLLLVGGLGVGLVAAGRLARAREIQSLVSLPGPVAQEMPRAYVIEERVERRRIVGSTELVERLAGLRAEGGVVRVVDRLSRGAGLVTLDREIVRRVEREIPLLRSSVDVAFTVQGIGYGHRFGAVVVIENLLDAPAEIRLRVPRPKGGGSLESFYLRVEGKEIRDEVEDVLVWSETLPGRGRVAAEIGYGISGSRGYRLEFAPGRVREFALRMRADREVAMDKGTLTPSEAKSRSAVWRLNDVDPAAPIAFGFPHGAPWTVGRDRAMEFAPVSLALFALGAWALRSRRAGIASVGFSAGLVAMPALRSYVLPLEGLLIAIGLAMVFGGVALGSRRGLYVGLVGGLLAAAPALTPHATLWTWAVGVLALVPLVRVRERIPEPARAYLA